MQFTDFDKWDVMWQAAIDNIVHSQIKLKRFVGYRSRFYWQGTVSLLLVAVWRVEKCFATGAKRSSYRTCITLRRGKVVCRKCCRKLINKSAIVKGVCCIFLIADSIRVSISLWSLKINVLLLKKLLSPLWIFLCLYGVLTICQNKLVGTTVE